MTIFDKLRSVVAFCDDSGRSDLAQIIVNAVDMLRASADDKKRTVEAYEVELARRPKWNGGFAEARQIALGILADKGPEDINAFVEKLAETLVEAFDNGVLAEHNALLNEHRKELEAAKRVMGRELLVQLLWEHGIGIASLTEMEARTRKVARGELKLPPDEPKLWFTSIEVMVDCLRKRVDA